jgi:DNA gyrase subunit B
MAKPSTKVVNKDDYSAEDIKQLPYPENVRRRPQVYIGNLDNVGSLTCLREIVNNSVDEHLRGFCSKINVVRISDRQFMVTDNGRGVPFDMHESGKNALEVIFGELHSGRNFDDEAKSEYTTGLNGVGASVVNAVSKSFVVASRRKDTVATIAFQKGVLYPPSKKERLQIQTGVPKGKGYASGTVVTFELDDTLFTEYATDDEVEQLLRETAYLNNGLEVTFKRPDKTEPVRFQFEHGLEGFLSEEVPKEKMLIKPITFEAAEKDIRYEVSLTWTPDFKSEVFHSFCNTIRTSDGGVHVTGLKRALSQHLTEYIRSNKLIKETLDSEDVFNGLIAMVSVFVYNPKYASQTKQKLTNSDVNGTTFSISTSALKDWMAKNGKVMKALAERFALTARARTAAKRAVEQVKKDAGPMMSSLNSIKKFTDCTGSDDCELLIVEGESAAGTVIDCRDQSIQAVYELKGKPFNTLNKSTDVILANNELGDLTSVMKCGLGADCDMSKTKFQRVIVVADADDDGSHIELLTSSFYIAHMRPLVEEGRLYIAQAPLYRVTASGKKPVYFKTKADLDAFYLSEVEKNFVFTVKGKSQSGEKKIKTFGKLMSYYDEITKFGEAYRLDPHVVEMCFLHNYDGEGDWEFGKRVEASVDEGSNQLSVVGFHRDEDSGEEHFLALVGEDMDVFGERFSSLWALFTDVIEIGIRKDDEEVEGTTLYQKISSFQKKLERTYKVLRFKGLGEANPDELWATTLNPETRELVQVTITDYDEAMSIVDAFMNPNRVDFRKEFLVETFKEVDGEALSY